MNVRGGPCAAAWLTAFAMGVAAFPLVAQDSAAHSSSTTTASSVRGSLPVRFAFTGDINLGTITIPDGLPPDSGRALFTAVDSLLSGDLVVGNFEGVLADSGTSLKCGPPPDTTTDSLVVHPLPRPSPRRAGKGGPRLKERHLCYAFATPTFLARRLIDAGFTHLNLANNHANDFGLAARAHTDSTLNALGLRTYGPLGQIVIDTLGSGDSVTVVGLIGFTTYPFAYDLLDLPRSVAVVDSVRRLVDVLVVTFHGGTEGAKAVRLGDGKEFLGKEPRGDLRRWAHAVIDAG
ncbi:MAG: CapA family protein, partial [Gemmatimonadota bacterium]